MPIIPNAIGMTQPNATSTMNAAGFRTLDYLGEGETVTEILSINGKGPGENEDANVLINLTLG